MLDRLDETVVAISSAPGFGAVGIVRMTGPKAIAIADQMVVLADGVSANGLGGFRRIDGEVLLEGGSLPACIYLFRAPRSYTRQHLVEIHTVGSPAVLEVVRKTATGLGARPAEPGEFTARAYLNGAMDLASAEGVARLIRAQSDTQLRAARRMMDGSLAVQIDGVRDELAELLGLVEAEIDFVEEPIEFIAPKELKTQLEGIAGALRKLMTTAKSAEAFNTLPRVLLIGPPNSGKSSLMNRLSGTSRAICSTVAGTTRDLLSAPIRVGRGEAILMDSAGVDESDDAIISQARAMALSAAERVDLLCVVLDADRIHAAFRGDEVAADGSYPDEFFGKIETLTIPRRVIALNKCDLLDDSQYCEVLNWLDQARLGAGYLVSALNGSGLEALRSAIAEALGTQESTVIGESLLLSERQRMAIAEAASSLNRATKLCRSTMQTADCADLLAFELREGLDALGAVTGAVTTDDVLGAIFANFCIGK